MLPKDLKKYHLASVFEWKYVQGRECNMCEESINGLHYDTNQANVQSASDNAS